jgi:hypothetical protein
LSHYSADEARTSGPAALFERPFAGPAAITSRRPGITARGQFLRTPGSSSTPIGTMIRTTAL